MNALAGFLVGFFADVIAHIFTSWRRDMQLRREGARQERARLAARSMDQAMDAAPRDVSERLRDGSF